MIYFCPMIQRIQTVFLFLASCLSGAQFLLPYERTDAGNPAATLPAFSDGVFNPLDNPGLAGLSALAALVSIAAVFLYKNRPLQARITGGALLSSVLLLALLAFSMYQIAGAIPAGGSVQYQAGLALPVLALICQWLAGRAIRKDEALVKSMDRLR